MKYILLVLFLMFSGGTHAAPGDSYIPPPAFVEFLVKTQGNLKETQKNLSNIPAMERGEHPYLAPLLWSEFDESPFTGRRGIGDRVDAPFGAVQVLSCTTGTERQPKILMMLDVGIREGWALQDISLQIDKRQNIQSMKPFYPVLLSKEGKLVPFQKNVGVPFVVTLDKAGINTSIDVLMAATACHEKMCEPVQVMAPLALTGPKNYPTMACPYIQMAFENIPNLVGADRLDALITGPNQIQILATGLDDPSPILYIKDHSFTIQKIQRSGDQILFTLDQISIPKNARIDIVVGSSKNLITRSVLPTPTEMMYFNPPAESAGYPWVILLFLMCSPLLTFLLFFKATNTQETISKSRQVVLTFLTFGVMLFAWFNVYPFDYGDQFYSWFWVFACSVIFIGAYWKNIPATAVNYALLTTIAPLVYLMPIWDHNASLVLAVAASMPYILFWIKPAIGLKVSAWSTKIPAKIKKLPLMVCSLWMAGMLISTALQPSVGYHPYASDKISSALQNNQPVMVSVQPDWCLSCTVLDAVNLKLSFVRDLTRQGFVILLKEDPLSITGKELMNRYQKKAVPLHILYGPKEPDGIRLPAYIPPYLIEKELKAVVQ